MRVAVIGGGAAGLAGAISACECGHEVTLFERQQRVGRKLMATGNGRCNLTNLHAAPENYHGGGSSFVAPALSAFTVSDTLRWFENMGLVWKEEEGGRVYPFSDQAGSVLDVLRFRTERLGAKVETSTEISEIVRKSGKYAVNNELFDRVIVACGGKAGEHLGGTGLGHELLRKLGHSITKLSPGLVQIKTNDDYTKMLKGVRAEAEVTLLRAGRVIAKKRGEVQFTDYGVSGIVIFDISGFVREGDTISLDLLPIKTEKEAAELINKRILDLPEFTGENLLAGILHSRLGKAVIKRAELGFTDKMGSFTERDAERTAKLIKGFTFTVRSTLGFSEAQVTRGGADTREFNAETMESRLVPGLYACGEVLDVDGDCGGYNLQWAWSSGRLAGRLL